MRIEIEIPREFESDYNGDMFKDFFSRVLCDIKEGRCLCGSYEIETAEMFLKAFDESKKAYDVDAVVKQLEKLEEHCLEMHDWQGQSALVDAINIIRNAGKDGAE